MTGILRRDREDEFSRRLRAGEPATAVWLTMSWPHTAEMLARPASMPR